MKMLCLKKTHPTDMWKKNEWKGIIKQERKDTRLMARIFTNELLNALLSIIMVMTGFYLLLQFLIFILSLNIKRILNNSKRTACEFLQKGSFWRGKNKKNSWYLNGPGTDRLRRNLLSMAREEIREKRFISNAVLYEQCTNCIFQYNCHQKYFISCDHCIYKRGCSLLHKKKTSAICNHFKCAKWIEKD